MKTYTKKGTAYFCNPDPLTIDESEPIDSDSVPSEVKSFLENQNMNVNNVNWSNEEVERLVELYHSGDNFPFPWERIAESLNNEFGNGRSIHSCRKRIQKARKKGLLNVY